MNGFIYPDIHHTLKAYRLLHVRTYLVYLMAELTEWDDEEEIEASWEGVLC